MKIQDLLAKLARNHELDAAEGNGSTVIGNREVYESFLSNPSNTMLISFPRTGSHWLRMLMELYFERPSLVRAFYYPDKTDYLTYHTHDMELDVEHPTALYLYRDPVDTIYSQLNYHKESPNDKTRITHWSDMYGRHLDKWLHRENFTSKKTVLRYDRLLGDLNAEFSKVTAHFGQSLDLDKLAQASMSTTKQETKRKTAHDPQVVSGRPDYELTRDVFRTHYADLVWSALTNGREHLMDDF